MTSNKTRRVICCIFMVESVISYLQTCQWPVSTARSLRGQRVDAVEGRAVCAADCREGLRLHDDDLRYSNGNSDCCSSDDSQRDRHVMCLIMGEELGWLECDVAGAVLQCRPCLLGQTVLLCWPPLPPHSDAVAWLMWDCFS